MLPLDASFRGLILKYIPELKDENIRRYENLTALRKELIDEKTADESGRKKYLPGKDDLIKRYSKEIHDIVEPYKKEFEAAHQIYMSRQRLAYAQSNLLQIKTRWKDVRYWFSALWDYRVKQLGNFARLYVSYLKKHFGGTILIVLIVLVLGILLQNVSLKISGQKIPPTKPNVTTQ